MAKTPFYIYTTGLQAGMVTHESHKKHLNVMCAEGQILSCRNYPDLYARYQHLYDIKPSKLKLLWYRTMRRLIRIGLLNPFLADVVLKNYIPEGYFMLPNWKNVDDLTVMLNMANRLGPGIQI